MLIMLQYSKMPLDRKLRNLLKDAVSSGENVILVKHRSTAEMTAVHLKRSLRITETNNNKGRNSIFL